MRVWTNGSFGRVWVGDTIYRYRDGALRVEESVKRVKGALDTALDEIVAWAPKGARLDPGLDQKRRKVLDAVALDDERVAAVISEGRSGPRLVIGPPKGPFEHDLALKGRAMTKVDWPASIWEAGEAPFSDDEKPSGATNRGVRIAANACGVGVAAAASGHVFLWRPGQDDLASALRVPGHDGARLDAVPTKQGVLVTLILEGQSSAVVHLAEDGGVLGRWPDGAAKGAFPALRLDDEKALAFDADKDVLALLSLPDLSELNRETLTDAVLEAATGPRGGTVILADATSVFDVTIDDESLSIDGPYLLSEAQRAAEDDADESSSGYDPARATGPSQISFPAGKKLPREPAWAIALGKDGRVAMRLRSGGGAGKGIRVTVSGAAVASGLVRPVLARVGNRSAELVPDAGELAAVLPDVELAQGIDWPLDPKPTKDDEKEAAQVLLDGTHFDLELILAGASAGNALLTVAVSAEGSSSAPLKRTRPITVEPPAS